MSEINELELRFREPTALPETHASHSWRGVSVQYSRLKLPVDYEFTWKGDCHYLAYHDLVLVDGEMEVSGEGPIVGGDLRDKMTFVPSGQTIQGWAKPADRMNAFTVVCFDPSLMEEELQTEFNSLEPRPEIYFEDKHLGATMRKLGGLMTRLEGPASRIYAETLGLTAALEMLRISVEKESAKTARKAGHLTCKQRALLTAYIEANLANDIGLDELANLCGLTRFHFCRAFKATFQETPFQYVTLRRVEWAQRMLTETRLPVATIAAACGFGGASQFGRVFRSVVGTTPLAYRRSL